MVRLHNFFSATTHGFFTDSHWRCNTEQDDLWYTNLYDDSSWSNALPISAVSSYDTDYLRDQFGLYAKLIWYFDADFNATLYCRARLAYGMIYMYINCSYLNVLVIPGALTLLRSVFGILLCKRLLA